ncbi:MAG: POTRA domain-containing protein, partial [bacterium]
MLQAAVLLAAYTAHGAAAAAASATPAGDSSTVFIEQKVQAILIEGTAAVKPADVSARIKTRIGAVLTRDTLREDLKSVWAMGRFEDVAVDVVPADGGARVTFIVKERPTVRELRFKGTKELGDKELRDAVPVKEGEVFDPVRVRQGEEKLLAAYREKGYPDVAVSSEAIPADKEPGRVDVVVSVTEGVKMHIRQIAFR